MRWLRVPRGMGAPSACGLGRAVGSRGAVGVTRCLCRWGGPIHVGTVPESGRLPGALTQGRTPLSMARLGLYCTQHRRAVARAAA